MDIKEIKFKLREEWGDIKITIKYFIKEPYFEVKKLFKGYYNSALLFWITILIFFNMWRRGILGRKLQIMGIIVFIIYFYMFHKSGIAKKYYQKEYLEGKEIE